MHYGLAHLYVPETHVALTPTIVLDLCDKQLFIQSCYFMHQNATCDKQV